MVSEPGFTRSFSMSDDPKKDVDKEPGKTRLFVMSDLTGRDLKKEMEDLGWTHFMGRQVNFPLGVWREPDNNEEYE